MLTSEDILGPGQRIAQRLPAYEHRAAQIAMANAVEAAMAEGKHVIVEAGTGVGKSFGYLVPAILTATADQDEHAPAGTKPKRIVISTHTIALQEQLMHKDIPFLTSILGREFSAVLVKGRRNYLSQRRLGLAKTKSGYLFNDEDEAKQLRDITTWVENTADGSLADLPFQPSGNVWDEVASDSGNCMGKKCENYKTCFYFRARRRAQNAQLLIVNHALFFSDLALRGEGAKLLPDYDAVVFDEAHTIEGVAAEHLGLKVTSGQIDYVLNKLYNRRTNRGLLAHDKYQRERDAVSRCADSADDFFSQVSEWLEKKKLTSKFFNGRVRETDIVENNLSPALDALSKMLHRAANLIPSESDRMDFQSAGDRLGSLANTVQEWVHQSHGDFVYWIESVKSRNRTRIELCASPIDISGALRDELFSKTRCAVLTSATLSTGQKGSFNFFKTRLGITNAQEHQLDSPFDYKKQAQLVVVRDMPDPTVDPRRYDELAFRAIKHYVAKTDGHAFVLFTSYELLRRAQQALMPWLIERNLALYSQADGTPRSQMVAQFKANPRGVLLGTDSFWQGVDVPGDALQNVIITKLPFSVPDQPLLEARLEAIRERGGNPFREYQIPEAIIKLRQGFGRLIRTQTDKGMVVLLDPRVVLKSYGELFLGALPDCERVFDSVTGFED